LDEDIAEKKGKQTKLLLLCCKYRASDIIGINQWKVTDFSCFVEEMKVMKHVQWLDNIRQLNEVDWLLMRAI
jgi:hypothetical protein